MWDLRAHFRVSPGGAAKALPGTAGDARMHIHVPGTGPPADTRENTD